MDNKMPRFQKFNEIRSGETKWGYVLLENVEEKKARNDSTYLQLTLSDGMKKITANKWDTSKEGFSFESGTVIAVILVCQEYQGKPSYVCKDVAHPAPKCNLKPEDFLISAPLDRQKMYDGILSFVDSSVEGSIDGTLAELTHHLYEKNKEQLLYWSAAQSIHHNFYGGLLYHTYRMVKQAKNLAELYPSLDSEVLVCATALHDIGKLKELDTDKMGNANYSLDGQLFGHALIGIEMVDKENESGKYDPEKIRNLKHCIAAHHGKLEYGAITLPHTEEAAALNYIDLIDSRIQQYENVEKDMEAGTLSDDKIFGLDRIQVYKPTFRKDLKIDY